MSGSAIEGEAPHTFLDDLESFYYVMLYIAMVYTAPDRRKEDLPALLSEWSKPLASDSKPGFLISDSRPKVSVWFGEPFQNLVDRLHSIFKNIFRQNFSAEFKGQPKPVVNRDEVYDTMISHIRQAIDDLGVEESERYVEHVTHAELRSADKLHSASDAGDDSSCKSPGRCKRLGIITTAAASRPRRRRVKYGITKV